MSARNRSALLIILLFFLLAFAGLSALYRVKTEEYAIGEAKKQALDMLLVHRAIHAYVVRVQRPEIYRLQAEGLLYRDYFSPKVMSFTFIARSVKELLNEERENEGLPEIYFKLATDNPRNAINQADPLESLILERMNSGGLEHLEEVIELEGKRHLYLATPIARSDSGCMRCHGRPADAPRELIAQYGATSGFFERENAIRAFISIRVPLEAQLASARTIASALSLGTLGFLAGLYAMIVFFVRRIDLQQRQIEHISRTDDLTGITNRRGLAEQLDAELERAARHAYPVALLMLDIDHFKRVNDRHGHAVGDELLRQFTALVRSRIRSSDIFGRWGGEEFIVVLPHQGIEDAACLAEKLRRSVEEAVLTGTSSVTVSIGVTGSRAGEPQGALIDRADAALYRSKEEGRNRVTVASPD